MNNTKLLLLWRGFCWCNETVLCNEIAGAYFVPGQVKSVPMEFEYGNREKEL